MPESTIEPVSKSTPRWKEVRAEFVAAQAGQCAICATDITLDAKLDHCHATGFIRGALCCSCNVKLGWYEGRREAIENYIATASEYAAYAAVPANRWT